jgi:hypothetical protein
VSFLPNADEGTSFDYGGDDSTAFELLRCWPRIRLSARLDLPRSSAASPHLGDQGHRICIFEDNPAGPLIGGNDWTVVDRSEFSIRLFSPVRIVDSWHENTSLLRSHPLAVLAAHYHRALVGARAGGVQDSIQSARQSNAQPDNRVEAGRLELGSGK